MTLHSLLERIKNNLARTTTITDDQILEAARASFLEEGFGVQTAKIARRAGVSEGSIFKRYPTKDALFYAALQIPYPPPWHQEIESLVGIRTLKENLIDLCVMILRQLHETLPMLITTLGSRVGHSPEGPFQGFQEPPPVRDARIISQYIMAEIALGRMRRCDPQRFVQILMGTLMHNIFQLFAARREPAEEEFHLLAEGTIDIIWEGISPTE